jgi:hypothetical protein
MLVLLDHLLLFGEMTACGVQAGKDCLLYSSFPSSFLNPPREKPARRRNRPSIDGQVCLPTSNRVNPTQNPSAHGFSLPLLQKRAGFACPFLLTEPAKSGFLLFDVP